MPRKKICDGDCFHCKYDDCINDKGIEAAVHDTERKKVYWDTHPDYRKRQNLNNKKRYYRLKNAGLCVDCGINPAVTGRTRCYECRIRNERNNLKRVKKGRELWRSNGKCYFCGEPALPGKKTCQRHYEIAVKSLSYAWNSTKSKEHQRKVSNAFWSSNHAEKGIKNGQPNNI